MKMKRNQKKIILLLLQNGSNTTLKDDVIFLHFIFCFFFINFKKQNGKTCKDYAQDWGHINTYNEAIKLFENSKNNSSNIKQQPNVPQQTNVETGN